VVVLFGSESIWKFQLGIQWVEVDLLLLVSTAGMSARLLASRTALRPTPLDWTIFGYATLVGVGAYVGIVRGVDLGLLRAELRPPAYLVLVYVIARISVDRLQKARLLYGVVFAATLLASFKVLAVYLLVPAGLAGERERLVLATRILNSDGGKRVLLHGGEVFPVLMILLALPWMARLGSPRKLALAGTALTFLVFAVLVSFTRSYWVGLAAGAASLLVYLPRGFSTRLALGTAFSGGAFALLVLALHFGFPSFSTDELSNRLRARAQTLLATEHDSSAQGRIAELAAIGGLFAESPLVGGGLGSTYQVYSRDLGRVRDWEYTHNSYAYYALKSGIVGLGSFLLVLGLGLATIGRLAFRHPSLEGRLLFAGLAASVVALLVTSLFAPWLTHYVGTAYVGLAFGAAEALRGRELASSGAERGSHRVAEAGESSLIGFDPGGMVR
jgi:O-antigen ligase